MQESYVELITIDELCELLNDKIISCRIAHIYDSGKINKLYIISHIHNHVRTIFKQIRNIKFFRYFERTV